MKKIRKPLPGILFICLFVSATICAHGQDSYVYKPKSLELYKTIVHMDSVYFDAYNNCDMAKQAEIYSDSIEFYHDSGGLEKSKQALLDAIKKNICGKVTRVLVKGSMEVYPIPGYGAVEIALHRFINHAENDHVSVPDRFVVVWRYQNNKWQITRVISLHMN
ncbi:MAG TPA: nuclear transport factor 2 family protein [Flavisolibacter sp.]|nr:nuclear transport factor 2 family protein [Flavisolibacter sp.]